MATATVKNKKLKQVSQRKDSVRTVKIGRSPRPHVVCLQVSPVQVVRYLNKPSAISASQMAKAIQKK